MAVSLICVVNSETLDSEAKRTYISEVWLAALSHDLSCVTVV
jgi:hypothetical protein